MNTISTFKRARANGKIKFLVLFTLSVLFTQTAFGQVKIGATMGFNVASIVDNSDTEWGSMFGFRGGVIVDLGLAKFFSIVPEVLFSQKGFELDMQGTTVTTTINYIEVPVSLALKLKIARNTRITISPGAYAAYAFSGNIKTTEGDKEKLDIGTGEDNLISPLDFGLSLALGLEVKHVIFRFQFHPGLANISSDKTYGAVNSAISMSLGCFF